MQKSWKFVIYFSLVFLLSFGTTALIVKSRKSDVGKTTIKTAGNSTRLGKSVVETQMAQLNNRSTAETPVELPTGQVAGVSTAKDVYKIAAFGDSMIETMGDDLDYLKKKLAEKYPETEFKMYNYGAGSENAESGAARIGNSFNRGGRVYPSLKDIKPDIIILGSFAYNPFEVHSKDRYWLALAGLISEAKKITPNVYIMAEVGPLYYGFGEGVGGINWDPKDAQEQSQKIKEQLESAVGLARATNTKLIDIYTKSLKESGYVDPKYVDTHDGIHPSIEGQEFTAEIITSTIEFK